MKNIVFISVNNPQNKQIRSGVPYSIYHQLVKYYDVVWIKPQVQGIKAFIYEFIGKVFEFVVRKIGYNSIHNPYRAKARSIYVQKQIDSVDYDAIFTLNTEEFAYIKTSKPILYRNDAIVHSMFDYYYFDVPDMIRKWAINLENKALKKVTFFLTPSQWVIDETKKYHVPFNMNKFQLVESGANIEKESIKYPKREYALDKPLRMIFVGYELKRKGIDVAYETLCILNEKYGIQTTLTIIGGKPEEKYLSHPMIKYVGKLDKSRPEEFKIFYDEFAKANLFIFPTRAECHGIVNCEAAAYGLPIYSYNTGGVSTYVKNGVNGECLPLEATGNDFAKAIYSAISDGKMPIYSDASKELYENYFNWDIWGIKVKKSIDSIIV